MLVVLLPEACDHLFGYAMLLMTFVYWTAFFVVTVVQSRKI